MAALVVSDSPDLLSTPTTLKQVLLDTGKPVPDTSGKTGTGKMVEAEAILSPRVTAVAPKLGTKRIFSGARAAATFSDNVLPSSINDGTLTLTRRGSSGPAAADVTYDPGVRNQRCRKH
jgi:hypothetical protein